MHQHPFPRFAHRALMVLALAAMAGSALAAPRPVETCDGVDAAACLEQMSLVVAARDAEDARPEVPKPRRGMRTVRSDSGPALPRLNLERSLSPEAGN